MRIATTALALVLTATAAAAEAPVTVSTEADAFAAAFCAADRGTQHVFVLPSSVFGERRSIDCAHGTAALRRVEPADDPGHMVVNIDPPAGVADGFDCDGKADVGMSLVAVNCLPANLESADHARP